MHSVSVVLILLVVAMASAAPTPHKQYYDVGNAKALFEDFIKKYNKTYKDDADKDVHFHAFVAALERINKGNEKDPNIIYDISRFSDYTKDELKTVGIRELLRN